MPRSFPDLASLKNNAKSRGFRQPYETETENDYRSAFADFMVNVDLIESGEIRSGLGWDQQHPMLMLAGLMSDKQRVDRSGVTEYVDGVRIERRGNITTMYKKEQS